MKKLLLLILCISVTMFSSSCSNNSEEEINNMNISVESFSLKDSSGNEVTSLTKDNEYTADFSLKAKNKKETSFTVSVLSPYIDISSVIECNTADVKTDTQHLSCTYFAKSSKSYELKMSISVKPSYDIPNAYNLFLIGSNKGNIENNTSSHLFVSLPYDFHYYSDGECMICGKSREFADDYLSYIKLTEENNTWTGNAYYSSNGYLYDGFLEDGSFFYSPDVSYDYDENNRVIDYTYETTSNNYTHQYKAIFNYDNDILTSIDLRCMSYADKTIIRTYYFENNRVSKIYYYDDYDKPQEKYASFSYNDQGLISSIITHKQYTSVRGVNSKEEYYEYDNEKHLVKYSYISRSDNKGTVNFTINETSQYVYENGKIISYSYYHTSSNNVSNSYTTTYRYDSFGYCTNEESSSQSQDTYRYDSLGRLTKDVYYTYEYEDGGSYYTKKTSIENSSNYTTYFNTVDNNGIRRCSEEYKHSTDSDGNEEIEHYIYIYFKD